LGTKPNTPAYPGTYSVVGDSALKELIGSKNKDQCSISHNKNPEIFGQMQAEKTSSQTGEFIDSGLVQRKEG